MNGERAHSRLGKGREGATSKVGGARERETSHSHSLAPHCCTNWKRPQRAAAFATSSLFSPSLFFHPNWVGEVSKKKAALNVTTNGSLSFPPSLSLLSPSPLRPLGGHLYFAGVLNHPCHRKQAGPPFSLSVPPSGFTNRLVCLLQQGYAEVHLNSVIKKLLCESLH